MAENARTFLDISLSKYRRKLVALYVLFSFSLFAFILDLFAAFLFFIILPYHSIPILTRYNLSLKFLGIFGLQIFFPVYVFFVGFSIVREYKEQYEVFQRQKYAENLSYDTLVSLLPKDFLIFRNVSLGYGDIDVIIVSVKGIYAIEVKSNRGTIYLDDTGYIHVKDGDTVTKQYRRQVISESNRLKRYLDAEIGSKTFVYPVLLFPLATVMKDMYLLNANDRYKVPVLSLNGIVEYIRAQETLIMTKDKVASVVKAINKIIEGKVIFNDQKE